VDYLRGRPVPPQQDTGVVLVTPQSMNDPEYKDLLSPDLSKYRE
jgi:hypothetical protein